MKLLIIFDKRTQHFALDPANYVTGLSRGNRRELILDGPALRKINVLLIFAFHLLMCSFIGGTGSSLPHEGFYPAAESRGYRLVAVLLAALVSLAVEHRL